MGFLELGKMTFGSMFKKPETILYPVQKKEAPAGLKGEITIDESSCILCGSCQRTCPTDALVVDREARTWSINHFRCIMCDMCVRACPKKCLEMTTQYPPVATAVATDDHIIPEQPKPAPKAAAAAEPAAAE